MRETIHSNPSGEIDRSIVVDLLDTYEKAIGKFRGGDPEGCLAAAGKFVEHVLRAIEYVHTGVAPPEIKAVAATVKVIEGYASLPEPMRLLIPRIVYGMIYDLRSKRGAVHVKKEIDSRHIDASLAVHAASWVLAEMLRLYHSAAESAVAEAMSALMQDPMPYVEHFGEERVVTAKVSCDVELLLLLAKSMPNGLDRAALGRSCKFPPPTVTRTIQRLQRERFVHRTKDRRYHITGPGERHLSLSIAPRGQIAISGARVS